MAKKDLDVILSKVKAQIDASNNLRAELNRYTHEYSVSTPQLYRQLLVQLNELISTIDTPNDLEIRRRKEVLRALTKAYVAAMYIYFKSAQKSSSKGVTFRFIAGSSEQGFTVFISTPKDSKVNVFGLVNKARKENLPQLREEVIKQIFNNSTNETVERTVRGVYSPELDRRSGGLLQLGHDKSGSVSVRRKAQLLKEFQYKSNIDRLLTGVSTSRELKAEIQVAVSTFAIGAYNNLKDFSVTVKLNEESAASNQRDSAKEKAFLRNLTNEVRTVLKKEVDFFNQRGSPSALEIVKARLINTAIKAGAKGKTRPIKNSKNKASTKVYQKTTKSKGRESIDATIPKAPTREVDPSNRNWLQLIPLINAQLTDKVMQNMSSPRLVNRTGRFAQSAKVVNVEQTPKGLPSFVFDYERDPYDVFDRTLGRAPWNTPQRDPRTLVDTSVREIVREMAIGRFFTRRA